MIMIYITCKDVKEAKRITHHLLKKKLIACANIIPRINSIYPWKGKMIDDKETVLIVKTENKYYNKVKDEVRKIHSYTVPCIMKIDVKVNKDYEKWLRSCLK